MSIININDVELELNLLDADVLEKYERLNDEISIRIQEPTQYEGISNADALRKQCRHVDYFFDELFGTGTAEKLFGKGSDLGKRMEAFAQVSAASKNTRAELISIQDKYGVGRLQNRTAPQHPHKKQKYNNKGNYRR